MPGPAPVEVCRIAHVAFDVASSAGWYSAVAGLLAGFAFVAVLLPLDHDTESDDERATAHAVVVFVCAFFSLLVLSLTYAVLAGRTAGEAADGIAAHEQLVNGAAFGLSVLLLLFGLRSVLGAYGQNKHVFEPARDLVLVVTSVLGPAVLLALQFSNALDVELYRSEVSRDEVCALGGLPSGVWVNLAITLAGVLVVLALALGRRRLPRVPRAPEILAKAVLGLACAFAAWSALAVPLVGAAVVTSAAFEHATVALGAVLASAFAAVSWSCR